MDFVDHHAPNTITMTAQTQLPELLTTFNTATCTAASGLPSAESIIPPENGITLLDAKNEIFLAYLQGLALRNLNVIRSLKNGSSVEDVQKLNDSITKKLVEQKVYLERGVRPLEGKIKYQTERVIKAAEDEDRVDKLKTNGVKKVNGSARKGWEEDDGSASDSEDEDDSEEFDEDEEALARPNAASLNKNIRDNAESDRRAKTKEDGVYRPPRVSATTMPTVSAREEKQDRRPARSRTLDEYINTELSAAPVAQPSIGSTIAAGGRRDKDARQLAREQERRNYEETNMVRLPKESKKELSKQKSRDRQRDGGGFGGDEWRGLGESVDRIGDLTKRKGGREGALEKSRKRKVTGTQDGPRGDGVGDAFEKKRRRVMKKRR